MKYYGAIGFSEENVEVRPGVFRAGIVEHMYAGEYNSLSTSYRTSDHTSDDISISAEVSVIGDHHAFENISRILYVTWRGAKWKVVNVDDTKHPRLDLTLGGEYIADEPEENSGESQTGST